MSEQEERQALINAYNNVVHHSEGLSPEERRKTEIAAFIEARERGWFTCPIEQLRWETHAA